MEYKIHPACAVIPLPPDQEIEELAASIKLSGLLEPITLTRDQLLLDGRCRLKACLIAGVEIRTEVYEGDPFIFVLDKNIRRRHLTKIQREVAAASLANLQHGSNQHRRKGKVEGSIGTSSSISIEEAAEKAGVSKSGIARARAIINNGAPHVVDMVATEKVKSYIASEAVRHVPKEAQANWTVEDVVREGLKRINNQPDKRDKATQPRKAQVDPYDALGYNGPLPSPGPHVQRGDQRVYLWASHIQDLMDDKGMIFVDVLGPVKTFRPIAEKDWKATPELIGAALKRLLTYKPKLVGGYNGEEIDFATPTRLMLKNLADGDKIRRAIEWLTGVQAAIAEAETFAQAALDQPAVADT